jgi:hypothetical protein
MADILMVEEIDLITNASNSLAKAGGPGRDDADRAIRLVVGFEVAQGIGLVA